MKKALLLGILVCALMATGAQAVTVRMAWQGTSDSTIELGPSQSAVIEFWLDIPAGAAPSAAFGPNDSVQTFFTEYTTTPPGTVSTIPGPTAGQAGWSTGGALGVMGDIGVQYAVASNDPLNVFLSAPGSYLLGTETIHLDSGSPSDMIEIMFANYDLLGNLAAGGAGSYLYDSRYNTSYVGYYAFGLGSPLVGGMGGNPANPLMIHVPEPASLALLALGGLALLRRR